MSRLQAPFPYFGGKSKIAPLVWRALGDVKHYMEPFFGSGAVLLQRPNYDPQRHIETVCDADGYVANVWRAIQFAPDEVAHWCDWPVNHADLIARRRRLVAQGQYLLENLTAEHDWLTGHGWTCKRWSTGGGYNNVGNGPRKANRHREVLWLSPHCLPVEAPRLI